MVRAQPTSPRSRRSLRTARLEAFSDGVFAIAITLLVLDLAIHPPGTPLQQVLNAWPSYLAYVVSFLSIGAAWIVHTALTDRLARADPVFLRLNLLLLLVVVFLPFPTRLVAEGLGEREAERVAATIYGLTLLAIRVCGAALDSYARREHLYAAKGTDEDDRDLQDSRRKSLIAVVVYMVAILIGLAVPTVAVAFYFGVAVYLVVPFRELTRLLFRH